VGEGTNVGVERTSSVGSSPGKGNPVQPIKISGINNSNCKRREVILFHKVGLLAQLIILPPGYVIGGINLEKELIT
jgi:hypothetical protein